MGDENYNGAGTPEARLGSIAELQPDLRNANRGTQRGGGMLEDSLRKYGAGRSVLADKHGNMIAGNKTLEQAAAIGMEDVIFVESDGTKLVVVQRTDLDIADPEARELAIADNHIGQVNLDWDPTILASLQQEDVDLACMWNENELAMLTGNVPEADDPRMLGDGLPDMGDEANACRMLTVYFKKTADVEAFGILMEQNITDKTKSLWYPVTSKPIR